MALFDVRSDSLNNASPLDEVRDKLAVVAVQSRLDDADLVPQSVLEDVFDLVDLILVEILVDPKDLVELRDTLDVQVRYSTPRKLVVYLEQPRLDVLVVRDEYRQRIYELDLVVDLERGEWRRDAQLQQKPLGRRLRAADELVLRVSAHQRDLQQVRQLHVVAGGVPGHDVGRLPADQLSDALDRARGVEELLREAEVRGESLAVLRAQEVETVLVLLDVPELEDLEVVLRDVLRDREGTDVDDGEERVLDLEDPGDLDIFALDVLVHGESLELIEGEAVDVDLDAPLPPDVPPVLLEVFREPVEVLQNFFVFLADLRLRFPAEQVDARVLLDDAHLLDHELDALVLPVAHEHADVALNFDGSQDAAPLAAELPARDIQAFQDFLVVDDAVEQFVLGGALQLFGEEGDLLAVHVEQPQVVLLGEPLEFADDDPDLPEHALVSALVADVLGSLFQNLSLPDDEVVETVGVEDLRVALGVVFQVHAQVLVLLNGVLALVHREVVLVRSAELRLQNLRLRQVDVPVVGRLRSAMLRLLDILKVHLQICEIYLIILRADFLLYEFFVKLVEAL